MKSLSEYFFEKIGGKYTYKNTHNTHHTPQRENIIRYLKNIVYSLQFSKLLKVELLSMFLLQKN